MTRTEFLGVLCAFATLSVLAPMVLAPVAAQSFTRGDQDRARGDPSDRKSMPFAAIKRKVEAEMGDDYSYVGVAPPQRDGLLRMQFLRRDGKVIWVDVDSYTANIVGRTR